MSITKKATAITAALVFAASSMMLTGAAHATGNPDSLDQGDFTIQCRHQYGKKGWQARLYGNTIADWKCFYNDGWPWSPWTSEKRSIDVSNYCWRHWGNAGKWRDVNDPYSWYCG